MIEAAGKNGIMARIIKDSISESGIRLTTMLVDYPRIVHAEQLKHRMFSTSAASSRAIPFTKMVDQLTGMPVSFGKNQSGMQAGEDYSAPIKFYSKNDNGDDMVVELAPEQAWECAKKDALKWAKRFADAGYHKQVYNRRTEADQMIRVLITATEWNNFWWLRNDDAADPTLHETARVMQEAYEASTPGRLEAGQWHLPFVEYDSIVYYIMDEEGNEDILTLEEAIKVSCARCAAQSFRNIDYDLAKSEQVYDRLVNGDKIHAGALEHVATPMSVESFGSINDPTQPWDWEDGVSHADRNGQLWSGNFRGWVQYRKLVPGENYVG